MNKVIIPQRWDDQFLIMFYPMNNRLNSLLFCSWIMSSNWMDLVYVICLFGLVSWKLLLHNNVHPSIFLSFFRNRKVNKGISNEILLEFWGSIDCLRRATALKWETTPRKFRRNERMRRLKFLWKSSLLRYALLIFALNLF